MTVRELVEHLRDFPAEAKIQINIRGEVAEPTDVDWLVNEDRSVVAEIHDYPIESN